MTSHQDKLYAFILSLVGHPGMADDILQETNIILWRKAAQFELGSNFKAWMYRIAHFQMLTYMKKVNNSVLVFDSEKIPDLVAQVADSLEDYDERQQALRVCLKKLSPRQRDVIYRRYSSETSLETIAREVGDTVAAIKQVLFRTRSTLESCIRKSLAQEHG
jgi:RNA polymerase sigma-70 factor (ECF subfamily)